MGFKGVFNARTCFPDVASRKQRVQINSATSSLLSVNAGVTQGSVLGSLLFLISVNDIAENLLSLVTWVIQKVMLTQLYFSNKRKYI